MKLESIKCGVIYKESKIELDFLNKILIYVTMYMVPNCLIIPYHSYSFNCTIYAKKKKIFLMKIIHNFLLFVVCSVGGTAGAVVTCPLEVVKTRLQSSNAFLSTPMRSARVSETSSIQNSYSALRRPEQRRKFSSTILKRVRPQVFAKNSL